MTGLSILDPILHFLKSVGNTSLFLATRYGALAGIAWLLAYVIFYRRWKHRKVVPKLPPGSEIRREMLFSAFSVVIFAGVGALTVIAARQGWTQMYTRMDRYPAAWFWASIACAILIHDPWFYGLYFNVRDRLMKTNHPDYERRFREVTGRERERQNH